MATLEADGEDLVGVPDEAPAAAIYAHIAPGPSCLTGRSVLEQGEPIRAHLRFMQSLFDDGTLLLGGPTRDGMSGLAVLEVPDVATARALASADPGVVADVLASDVQELVAFFDVLASDAPTPRRCRCVQRLTDSSIRWSSP